jgi:hypothetical protein
MLVAALSADFGPTCLLPARRCYKSCTIGLDMVAVAIRHK